MSENIKHWLIFILVLLIFIVLVDKCEAQEIPIKTEDGYGWGEETALNYDLYLLAMKYPDLFENSTFPLYEYKIQKVYSDEYKEHVLKPYIITTALFVAYIIVDVISDRSNYKRLERLIE